MPRIQFTSNLRRFYPNLSEIKIEAQTIAHAIEMINEKYPGIKNYIIDDQNILRRHVNIFINDTMIKDRVKLKDNIQKNDTVLIMQALSGG
ncbi:MAG: MoaD/ThiS family protein [Cyclobacteriaceae bacterium]|nr:MoaD/ThiS family protein [Cyclobacteriaceae bacterium]MCK5470614.1 MoaD/ThiS family protein [Cyclobacteriaceae bacterium]MCK5703009.1 MoaD/ThiS family protein [Cyclobacteriaceae bacterium]